ncbi:2-polyprenyl-6-methoxyphenol hydroxylase-like FAD-dependent oxidoreductase [Methylorubrum rhodinum]|uniref:2-polyprenyl-6-methoxyphenol hydroxylase-like FAD-dependent oxidoreductase n=1 Tax=Methylorubrum rhodinum TaxID=29428 RepID=A0A840ZI99_9HYPH|nr:NAD(P)/FAD-dependent oxidoreductase [Methylorubrum rhodinum]MBB5756583.1 2-polyprenyl-6-methoxyphenol hydroxylase-like FAD-dependent oxidoreductase [Methylorubrum rhodinum]
MVIQGFTHDVVVVGASVAGCAAAILFARSGLTVALVERDPDPAAYKRLCTHYIQSSALPVLERLGLDRAIEACGGVRNRLDLHTRWGWIREGEAAPGHPGHGYNLRRSRLDPLLRARAATTPGIELLAGHTATGLGREGGRVAWLSVRDRQGSERTLRGRLHVGADGRASPVARLAGIEARQTENARFFYYAAYRGLDPNGGRSRMWMGEAGISYTFPNEDGLTIAATTLPKALLPDFKADPEAALARTLAALPDGPNLTAAERVGPVMGFVDMPNQGRAAAVPGLALVGDAALSVDPVWGTGCAFALRSAEWLVAATADALLARGPVDRALRSYARRHRRTLAGHAWHIASYARGRRWWLPERIMFEAAALDPHHAGRLFAYASRNIGLTEFMAPTALARAAATVLRTRLAGRRRRLGPRIEAV